MNLEQKVAKLKKDIIEIKASQEMGASDSCVYKIAENLVLEYTGSWAQQTYMRFKSEGKFYPKIIVYAEGYVNGSKVSSDRMNVSIMSQRSLFDYMTGKNMQDSDECIVSIVLNGGSNSFSAKVVATVYADCRGKITWGVNL